MKRYPSRPRARQTFTLTGVENRAQSNGNERLVCFVPGEPGLLVLWGTTGGDTAHIEAVEQHGFHVTITCDWLRPNDDHAEKYGHRYWVDEDDHFEIVG
jgi:hypothetical protein